MLEQVLTHIHNWFRVRDDVDGIHPGEYTIQDGAITLPFLQDGQYFRIIDSVFNDGLHRYGPDMEALTDETFDGAVWALAIPKAVVDLATEMAEWQEKYGAKAAGVYQSESFINYSRTLKTNKNGESVTVWDVFKDRLKPYQKIRET